MSAKTEALAARLIEEYATVLDFACAKAWYKWRSYLAGSGHHAAFEKADIRQLATEALLLFGGAMPEHTRKSQSGTLAKIEAEGGAAYVQRSIDLYVSSALLKLVEKSRAVTRGGDLPPPKSIDAPLPGYLDRTEAIEHDGAVETNHVSLPDLGTRFPVLYLLEVETYPHEEAQRITGLDATAFERQRKEELAAFTSWATANRRVAEGAKPRRRRKPCPYGAESCTGVHVRSAGAEKMCPGLKDIRAAERRAWNDKRSAERRALREERERVAASALHLITGRPRLASMGPANDDLLPRLQAPDGIPAPRKITEHNLTTIREEIYVASERVYALQVDLNGAEEYLAALRVREAGLAMREGQKPSEDDRPIEGGQPLSRRRKATQLPTRFSASGG